jgi:imidazolonepropionase-like amidohydrolase
MKLVKVSIIALAMAANVADAATIAIKNATIYTATSQGILSNATLVMTDGKISAINPEIIDAEQVIDAEGKILTPGLISSMNSLGLVEVSAVSSSRDGEEEKADITFDPSLAFNPLSSLIAYSRKGGITTDLVAPNGGNSIFKGQIFAANLSGDFDSIVQAGSAVYVSLGAKHKGSRAFDLQQLANTLADRQKELEDLAQTKKKSSKKDAKDDKVKEPNREQKIVDRLLAGTLPLVADANRATDLLQLLKLKQQYNLDLIINGAADAVLVATQLAAAKVPVIIYSLRDLPDSFDSLHNSLENAAILAKAGVTLILSTSGDTHNLNQLRFDAGVAVAYGLDSQQALASISANVADAFHLNTGKIAVGKDADLVLWSGDPFELSSKVEKMWIAGEQKSTNSRQDALRERYMTQSSMPKAYIK